MKLKKIQFYLAFSSVLLLGSLSPSVLFSQIISDEEEIPYGIFDADIFLVFLRDKSYVYESYTLARTSSTSAGQTQAGMTQSIGGKGVNEKTYTGIGAGIDARLPFLYALFNKNRSRLRVADDFGLGTFLTTNRLSVKDAPSKQKIEPEYLNNVVPVDFGLTFYYGLQAIYRINNTFDFGVKYLPIFTTGNSRVSIINATWGLHLRVHQFYIDFRQTPYKLSKFNEGDYDTKGGKFISIKYLLPSNFTFRDRGYVFASLQSFTYQSKDLYQTGNTFIPTGFENYVQEKNHFNVFKIGIGLMVN